jgi:hypothetical protein
MEESITVTISGLGASHSFHLPVATAVAWMTAAGIPLAVPAEALAQASLLIVKPIVQAGLAAQQAQQESAILAAVEQGI